MSYITYEVRVYGNGDRHWYQDGNRHRTDGPSCEEADGTKWWYQNGKQHRIDGPAIENADGQKRWYINGVELTESQFNSPSFMEFIKLVN